MRTLALCLFLLVAIPAAAQEWQSGPLPGDESVRSAVWIRNSDDHILVLRGEDDDGQYWLFAEFRPGGGEALGDSIPSRQFPGGDPLDSSWQLDREQYGKIWGHLEKTKASWVIATFPERHFAASGVVQQWLQGGEVTIIYVNDAGAEKTTRFPLAGLKGALAAATGWDLGN